jgi:hypothetical protein
MTYDPTYLARQEAARQLQERVALQYRLAERISSASYIEYLKHVVIDSAPEPRKFVEKAEDWQWDQAYTVAGPLEVVCGVKKKYDGPRMLWRTLPRGHDKTSSTGRALNWCLAFTKRYFSAVVAAADREQAGYLTEFMRQEADLNPWFKNRLQFKTNTVVGYNGANLKVLAADAFGTFGQKPDITICDELSHWQSEGLWEALYTGLGKRAGRGVLLILSNAGVIGSWQWKVREEARRSYEMFRRTGRPGLWHFFEAPGPMASWMKGTELFREQERTLPPNVFKRLFLNKWLDPADDCGFVTRGEAQACADKGRELGLAMRDKGEPDVEYVASIDYGPKKDRTVCTVGHREGETLPIDRMEVWQGKDFPDGRVPVAKVEEWIETTAKNFPKVTFLCDPYQLEGTIQRYSSVYPMERFEPRGGKANYEMAQILRLLLCERRIFWYPGCGSVLVKHPGGALQEHTLVDELAELITKQMSYGYRLDHMSNKHDDRAVGIGMLAWRLIGSERRRQFRFSEHYL